MGRWVGHNGVGVMHNGNWWSRSNPLVKRSIFFPEVRMTSGEDRHAPRDDFKIYGGMEDDAR